MTNIFFYNLNLELTILDCCILTEQRTIMHVEQILWIFYLILSFFGVQKVILVDCEDQIKKLLRETFENYKSLNEFSLTGLTDSFGPIVDSAAPALGPAVRLFGLLHDVLSPAGQDLLRNYLQASPCFCKNYNLCYTSFSIFVFFFFFLTNSNFLLCIVMLKSWTIP